MIEHRALYNFILVSSKEYQLQKSDRLLQFCSLSFDIAVEEIFLSLGTGASLYLRTPEMVSSIALLLEKCQDWEITVLDIPTAYWHQLVDTLAERKQPIPPSLRLVIVGGEKMELPRVKLWQQLVGDRLLLVNTYGPTEATVTATTYWISGHDHVVNTEVEIPIGKPLAHVNAYVLDSELQPVTSGIVGDLYLETIALARGYLNRPDLTAKSFVSLSLRGKQLRCYKTGDRAMWLPDGNLMYLDRADRQIKIRGYRIELGEIESAIQKYPTVKDIVVLAQEKDDSHSLEKYLVGYLVPQANQNIDLESLREFLYKKLPDYMVPRFYEILPQLPVTPNGKIDRRALPIPQFLPSESDYIAPRTDLEKVIARIWAEVLQLEKVGINDNFLGLGGHSLNAIRIVTRLQEALGISLSLQSLFQSPTVEQLAIEVDVTLKNIQDVQILSQSLRSLVSWKRSLSLSPVQASLWFLDQLNPNSPFYNIPTALHLEGYLNYPALRQSLQEIVRRHSALRTNFTTLDGEPIQVIAPIVTLDVPVVDLRTLPDPEQAIETRRLINAEAAKPFNLTQDTLIRVLLLQLGNDRQVLVVTIHHIVTDGWSMGIFVEELTSLYKAFRIGHPSPLPELTIQFPDFVVWQDQWLKSGILASQITYWQKQLAGVPDLLELPYDRPRPTKQTYVGATQSFPLPTDLSEAIVLLSRKHNVTLFMTLVAAFQTLMFRYTQSTDICIGTPVANRNQSEVEGLIGMFVNTVVLRTDLADYPSFIKLLGRVREVALDAYTHQDVPLQQLMEVLQPQRSLSYSPLFQVVFVLQNAAVVTGDLEGLKVSNLTVETNTAKFDLTLSMEETATGLVGNWEYNTDLFDHSTIKRMSGHFQTLLQGIVANPQTKISHLPLLTESEQQLFQLWNHTQTDYPREATINELFETQAAQTPEAIALVFGDSQKGGLRQRQITYQELNHQANRLAHHLQRLGVTTEVAVGICLERSIAMIVGILAILKAGGVYVPLDPSYPPDRLAFMFTNAQVEILLTEAKLADQLPRHHAQVIRLDLDSEVISNYSPENLPTPTTATNLAYIMYTSGSTGEPKGVCVTHRGVVRLIKENNYANLNAQEVFLQLAPIAFDASTLEIWGSLLNGAKLVILPPHQPSLLELGRVIRDSQVTTLWLTAGLFHLMVDDRMADLKHLRQLLAGGDVLSVPHVQKFLQEAVDCQLINGYGPTENTTFTCCYPITPTTPLVGIASPLENRPIPIGRPLANTQVYILDAYLQPVPIGVRGELYTGGDGLARGYLRRPDLTAERFIPHPFAEGERLYKTGDLARYLPDGNIEFLGRIDNQVKIRGFRIELGEIEAAIAQHPQIREVIVIAREEAIGDKRLVAYLVAHQTPAPTAEELRNFLSQKLPEYMIPAAFTILDALPLNPVGKVDRHALHLQKTRFLEPTITRATPQSNLEAQLLVIWQEVLGNKRITVEDNFFQSGGTSLIALRLFSRIEVEFQQRLPLTTLLQAPTIRQLSTFLQTQGEQVSWRSLVPIQAQGTRLPLFCIHALGGNVLGYQGLIPYLSPDQPVYGLQAKGLDGKEEAIDDIKVMASNYIREIQTLQPTGPYLLAGYSAGGTIAYEIAQQLRQAGQEIAALIFFDVINPQLFRIETPSLLEQIAIHNSNLTKLALFKKLKYIKYRVGVKADALTTRIYHRLYALLGYSKPSSAIPEYLVKLESMHQQALDFYVPQPYDGNIIQFQSIEKSAKIHPDPSLGWEEIVTGRIDIIDGIPGHHGTMFETSQLAFVGKKLKEVLEEINSHSKIST